jgi:hypothetical protein
VRAIPLPVLSDHAAQPHRTELPENSPRYVVLSYELTHPDGRRSFPLVLVNWAPITSAVDLLTLHASALLDFQTQARICSRRYQLRH